MSQLISSGEITNVPQVARPDMPAGLACNVIKAFIFQDLLIDHSDQRITKFLEIEIIFSIHNKVRAVHWRKAPKP